MLAVRVIIPSHDRDRINLINDQRSSIYPYAPLIDNTDKVQLNRPKMAPHDALDTNIVLAIHPPQVANIVSRIKSHEFRRYLLPSTARRMWIYETRPIPAIRYAAVISGPKKKKKNSGGTRPRKSCRAPER